MSAYDAVMGSPAIMSTFYFAADASRAGEVRAHYDPAIQLFATWGWISIPSMVIATMACTQWAARFASWSMSPSGPPHRPGWYVTSWPRPYEETCEAKDRGLTVMG